MVGPGFSRSRGSRGCTKRGSLGHRWGARKRLPSTTRTLVTTIRGNRSVWGAGLGPSRWGETIAKIVVGQRTYPLRSLENRVDMVGRPIGLIVLDWTTVSSCKAMNTVHKTRWDRTRRGQLDRSVFVVERGIIHVTWNVSFSER